MKPLLSHSLVALLFIVACGGDNATDVDGGSGDSSLASSNIGSGGGTLETDGFFLTVPAGAFHEETELILYSSDQIEELEDDDAHEKFMIKNIPSDFDDTLRIAVEYSGGPLQILHGVREEGDGFDDSSVVYFLASAMDSAGFAVSYIPPYGGTDPKQRHAGIRDHTIGWDDFIMIPRLKVEVIETDHFTIHYQADLKEQAITLGVILEDNIDISTGEGFGFSPDNWSWPINVWARPRIDELIMGFTPAHTPFFRIRESWMFQDDFDAIRQATGSAILGFAISSKFASPSQYVRADHLWFFTATRVWAEELFTRDAAFVRPLQFEGREEVPFWGPPLSVVGPYHSEVTGFGMAAIIKFLIDDPRFSKEKLLETYESIYAGTLPQDAWLANVDGLVGDWLPDFFRSYVTGEVYDVPPSAFSNPGSLGDIWEIRSASDTLWISPYTDNRLFYDLSAKLFVIKFDYPGLDSAASLTITPEDHIMNDGLKTLVFVRIEDSLVFLGETDATSSAFEIAEIRSYVDLGMDEFTVVVVNTDPASLRGWRDVDVKFEIDAADEGGVEDPVYNRCLAKFQFDGNYRRTSNGEITEFSDATTWGFFESTGSFSGNTFVGNYSEYGTYTGTLTVTLNEERDMVTGVSWSEDFDDDGLTSHTAVTAVNIPMSPTYPGIYQVLEEEACQSISSATYTSNSPVSETTLLSQECNRFSFVTISFREER